MMNKHDGTLLQLIECLQAHEPGVRVLGNVQAGDALAALLDLLPKYLMPRKSDAKRRICISIEGGIVQAIAADPGEPLHILIADFDADGYEDDEDGVYTMPHSGDRFIANDWHMTDSDQWHPEVCDLFDAAKASKKE